MTDTSFSLPITTGHTAPSAVPFAAALSDAPALQGVHEDEGQISCICGFNDDDGNTVACDICNRWQHIVCYYPQYEHNIPDDLQHWCVECRPRSIDRAAAHQRQKQSRIERDAVTNGVKRAPAKTSKKKKDAPGASYTNGWPLDKSRHDRNSASPRDQPPPAKRPKTNHRPSNSTVGGTTAGRRRNGSTVAHRRSTSEPPEAPQEMYSEEFLRAFLEEDWSETAVNLHNGIHVTNTLSQWLQQPEEDFRQENGVDRGEVFMRWDGDIADITQAEIVIETRTDTSSGIYHVDSGTTALPTWKAVTLKDPVAEGACLGELKGHIGLKIDYIDDSANRWSLLRHPEPFVFFHARLPVFIDARNEGNELRYVRRSCSPNARLQIMITEGAEYHFCFMATRHIEPGEEVAVAWDAHDGLAQGIGSNNKHNAPPDKGTLRLWASHVLANCGPCACDKDIDCMLSRFDRRKMPLYDEDEPSHAAKAQKSRKKKIGQHNSPLNTGHAVNSRSGSEARKIEPEDVSDSRSTSGSAGRASESRDMTPNTHYSANGSMVVQPELSERERKKLAKEEEMFRRQEEEASGKQKKKRNSAGSALNTPAAGTASKQFGFPPTGSSKQAGASSLKGAGKRAKSVGPQKEKPKAPYKTRPKPEYVDASTQCDLDEEDAVKRRLASPPSAKKYISVTQRLLERCALNNAKRKRPCPASPQAQTSSDSMDLDVPRPDSPTSSSPTATKQAHSDNVDVEMEDATSSGPVQPIPPTTAEPLHSDEAKPERSPSPLLSSQPQTELHAPPLSTTSSPPGTEKAVPSPGETGTPEMRIQMPPPPPSTMLGSGPNLTVVPIMVSTSAVAQSPISLATPTLFSPAVTAAVQPSPAKKKMSLSDWTKRKKAKDTDAEAAKSERESSPAPTATSGPGGPNANEARKAGDDAESTAAEDDVKVEPAAAPA